MPNSDDLSVLPDVLKRFPAIEAACLFGCNATGRLHQKSDLDLGLDGDLEALKAIRLDLLAALAQAGFGRVNLVFLPVAPPALRFHVVRHNRLLSPACYGSVE